MHKQTNRFLTRKELRKPTNQSDYKPKRKALNHPPGPGCLRASESVYELAVEVIMEGLSTLGLIAMAQGPPKSPNVARWSRTERKMSDL